MLQLGGPEDDPAVGEVLQREQPTPDFLAGGAALADSDEDVVPEVHEDAEPTLRDAPHAVPFPEGLPPHLRKRAWAQLCTSLVKTHSDPGPSTRAGALAASGRCFAR